MPASTEPAADSALVALTRDCLAKSGVLWVGKSEADARAAWFAYVDPCVYLLTGPGEQVLPELGSSAVLILRTKDTRERAAALPATVERLTPDEARWAPATEALAKGRLNASAPPAKLPARWAREATVLALTPDLDNAWR